MKSVFNQADKLELMDRVNKLTKASEPLWGKMDVSQMLAHCNVTYEMAFDNNHNRPSAIKRFLLKVFVKNAVVNDVPYKKGIPTAPQFIIKGNKDFDTEKKRLMEHIEKTQALGESYFAGKESLSFGKLTAGQWNNMFYKHLDHHLQQFGV